MDLTITLDGMQGRIADSGNGFGMVDFRADDRVNVTFYKKSVQDQIKSREAGRPVYVGRDYVRIQQPGEKDFADRPVSDDTSVIQRWPRHWERYQAKQDQIPPGTPVDLLFPQTPEIPANLHSLAVHTIEQLAGLTAEGVNQVGMGCSHWQAAAKRYLEQATKGVAHHQMQKELSDRDGKIEVQSQQIAMLQRQVDKLLAERQGVPHTMIPQQPPQYMQSAPLPQSAFGQQFDADNAGIELPSDGAERTKRKYTRRNKDD